MFNCFKPLLAKSTSQVHLLGDIDYISVNNWLQGNESERNNPIPRHVINISKEVPLSIPVFSYKWTNFGHFWKYLKWHKHVPNVALLLTWYTWFSLFDYFWPIQIPILELVQFTKSPAIWKLKFSIVGLLEWCREMRLPKDSEKRWQHSILEEPKKVGTHHASITNCT